MDRDSAQDAAQDGTTEAELVERDDPGLEDELDTPNGLGALSEGELTALLRDLEGNDRKIEREIAAAELDTSASSPNERSKLTAQLRYYNWLYAQFMDRATMAHKMANVWGRLAHIKNDEIDRRKFSGDVAGQTTGLRALREEIRDASFKYHDMTLKVLEFEEQAQEIKLDVAAVAAQLQRLRIVVHDGTASLDPFDASIADRLEAISLKRRGSFGDAVPPWSMPPQMGDMVTDIGKRFGESN